MTTPFPPAAGSPVTKTEDEYFCRNCYSVGPADYIEATGKITCSGCDNEDVCTAADYRRKVHAEREASFAERDREADERRRIQAAAPDLLVALKALLAAATLSATLYTPFSPTAPALVRAAKAIASATGEKP